MEIVTVVVSLIDKILKMMPDYDERKKDKYVSLKKDFITEINKPLDQRDADKILNIRDEILLIGKELSK